MTEPLLRAATAADVDAVAAIVIEGFGTYRGFAPEGWEPPDRLEFALGMAARIEDPAWWCVVAEAEEGLVGTCAFMPAAAHRRPSDEPGLAHLLTLFVRPPHWGSGLAARLHGRAVGEAAARGFTAMRLFTPAAQARARGFYEREGWRAVRGPFPEDHIGGLEIVEYRRPLP